MGRSRQQRWREGWEARGGQREAGSKIRLIKARGALLNTASYAAKSAMVIASGHVTPLALLDRADCFEGYTEGCNDSGLIASAHTAIEHFQRTIELGPLQDVMLKPRGGK